VIGAEEAERKLPPRVAAYRSPEACAGAEIDEASEVFSLGVLLHQIATGTLPFSGETTDELTESIQNDAAPPVSATRQDLPRELVMIIARCLKKDRGLRYPSVREVNVDIIKLKDDIVEGRLAVARHTGDEPKAAANERHAPETAGTLASLRGALEKLPDWRLPVGGAAALLLAFALGYVLGGSESAPESTPQATLTRATFGAGPDLFPRLAPDGGRLFFARAEHGDWGVYAQRIGEPEAIELTADSAFGDTQPALSADGTHIAFRSERDGGGIFVMGTDGANVRRLTDFGHNPSWAPDGSEIAVADAAVFEPSGRHAAPQAPISGPSRLRAASRSR